MLDLEISNTLVDLNRDDHGKKNFRKGQGTTNMERRAESIGAKVTIVKSPNTYTVHLTANLKFRKLLFDLF
jgi:signal transduction histidine kinase